MPAVVPITYEALDSAFQWSSSGAPYENEALLSRETGEVFFKSMSGDLEEELPEDIEDGTLYIAAPHKNDLNLGRNLVFEFLDDKAPSHCRTVESFFRQRGAYSKFKDLLERVDLLDKWYEYEARATRRALERWALANGFVVVQGPASDA